MSLCDVHWFSKVLQKHVGAAVILPEVGEPPFATYYLLHGLSDDYTGWCRRTRIESYVRDLPLIVVMPDGYRGFYTDNVEGPTYGKYIAEELTAFAERNFPAQRGRAGRCIGGLSMGGYGALRIALTYQERYISANSHSGALLYGSQDGPRVPSPLNATEQLHIFGPSSAGSANDLLSLVMRAKRQEELPSLLLDCGTEDQLLDDTRRMHLALERAGISHSYAEHPGAHDWDYWDRHLPGALAFHASALRIKRFPQST